MRQLLPVLLVLMLAGRAQGQVVHYDEPSAALIERSLTKEARKARLTRLILGGTTAAVGAALLPLGYYTYANAGHGFLRELDLGIGYTLMGGGALALIGGTILIVVHSPQEHAYAELEASLARGDRDHAIDRARRKIAHEARAIERRRTILRGIGLGSFIAGAAAITTVATTSLDLDSKAGKITFIGGSLGAFVGFELMLASLPQSPIEKMDDELPTVELVREASRMRPRIDAGLLPVRGGALVGIGGAF